MSDKLAAASLLLTIVAVLYSLWYPQLMASMETSVPHFAADRLHPRREVRRVLRGRAIPLFLAAFGVALVFLPDAAVIVLRSASIASREHFGAVRKYDSAATAFVLVEAIAMGFAIHLGGVLHRFRMLVKKLSRDDKVQSVTVSSPR